MMGYGTTGSANPGPGSGLRRWHGLQPRVIRVVAGPGYAFSPATITIAAARR
jgi:hypothetical protein